MTQNAYDDTAINNIALDMIGADNISSLQQKNDIAATCSRVYPMERDALFAAHDWGFVKAERQLARAANVTPLVGYKYAYKLPSNLLAGPEAVYADGSKDPTTDFKVVGDYLYGDFETVVIEFHAAADPSTWPAYFVRLVTLALSAAYAKPVMDDAALADTQYRKAFGPPEDQGRGGYFATARGLDAKMKPIKSLFRNGDPISRTRH